YHNITYYAILGLTISSLLIIYPGLNTVADTFIGVAAFIVGFVISYLFNIYGRKINKNNIVTN
ncbi:MAG: hypothetical protein WCR96_05820, partial [Candidatus Methanomethylophilaceae archaeon]